MANRPSLDDYIDVAERIEQFKIAHPEGSLQTIAWEIVKIPGPDMQTMDGHRVFVVYRAAAYRTPDDARPGHGTAWEPFPGGTPYTRDSELMNAETAAWGRAIVAVGLAANKKIASRQEVRARQESQVAEHAAEDPSPEGPATVETMEALRAAYTKAEPADDDFRMLLEKAGVDGAMTKPIADLMPTLTEAQATWVVLGLRGING